MGDWKEIFVFVVGTSPQVITETIYALGTAKPPIFPDEIYVLTTAVGKQNIIETIIKKNIIAELIKEYNFPEFNLIEKNILVPRDTNGSELNDICSYQDNEIIADMITSFIREKTRDPNSRLHCSIAGGRKTMSFYLGSAMQLFGRTWDRLNHVIVSPEFESNPEFFYKPKKDRELSVRTRDGVEKVVHTRQAKIMLADLPFIRLGPKLNLKGSTFRELVLESQKEIDLFARQPEVSANLAQRTVIVDGKVISFSPMIMFFFVSFLRLKINSCLHLERQYCLACKDCYQELGEIFGIESIKKNILDYDRIFGSKPWRTREFLNKWKDGIPAEVCRQYISKLNAEIETSLNDDFQASLLKVISIRIYASSRYGIRIEKRKVNIE
ncbi:MAG: CRISPR-associated ring nuclease Csm6 [Candidatus Aminicenantes bacterium]|nr:CRISPR-associated ring nuclease Csm6 [Candidatus Aminicenantes bacterium]